MVFKRAETIGQGRHGGILGCIVCHWILAIQGRQNDPSSDRLGIAGIFDLAPHGEQIHQEDEVMTAPEGQNDVVASTGKMVYLSGGLAIYHRVI